jgi:hypothetical protein
LFRAPASQTEALRHYLTGFLGLIALVPESVALPIGTADHDVMARPWAAYLSRIPVLTYPVSAPGVAGWLACDFRVQDVLPELLEEATAAGHDLLHQINFQSWSLTAEQARAARRNYVAVEKLRGRGPSNELFEMQRRLLFRPEGEVRIVSEEIGVGSPAAAKWCMQALERHFLSRYGAIKFDPPVFAFTGIDETPDSGCREEMTLGIHPALLNAPDVAQIMAMAVDSHAFVEAFDWGTRLQRWFEPSLGEEQSVLRVNYETTEAAEKNEEAQAIQLLAQRDVLEVCKDDSDYAFISYRRSDFGRIAPILDGLNQARMPFWFDRGLLGGEQWMARLQERIYHARYFLVFLSPAAVASRYVQMEIHFAHHIARPLIIPVQLDEISPHEMPGGLGMILGMLNVIPADQFRILEDLKLLGRSSGTG